MSFAGAHRMRPAGVTIREVDLSQRIPEMPILPTEIRTKSELLEAWGDVLLGRTDGADLIDGTAGISDRGFGAVDTGRYVIDTDVNSMYQQLTIPTMRQVMPELIASDLIGVRPMRPPDGDMFKFLNPAYRFNGELVQKPVEYVLIDHFTDEEDLFKL